MQFKYSMSKEDHENFYEFIGEKPKKYCNKLIKPIKQISQAKTNRQRIKDYDLARKAIKRLNSIV